MAAFFRTLFLENPMLDEALRARRKYYGGAKNKVANYAALALAVFTYLWWLSTIIKSGYHEADFIAMFELFIVTLVLPTSIYGAISGERERSTWEALILTRLTPAQIIAGKLLWRVGILVLLQILFTIPMLLPFNPLDRSSHWVDYATRGQWLTLTWGLLLCTFGLWISANTTRSVQSVAVIMGVILAFLILIPLLLAVFGGNGYRVESGNPLDWITWLVLRLNPFYIISRFNSSDYAYRQEPVDATAIGLELGVIQPFLYFISAVVLVFATYRSLKKLEVPARK